MYTLKPLQENFEIVHKPNCMYTMKSYYENETTSATKAPEQIISQSVSCNDLLKRQQKIFERLNALESRIDLLLGNKNEKKIDLEKFYKQSSSFKKLDKKVNANQIVKDVVIQMDPQSINYSVLVLFSQLCAKYKCFVQFFSHGSLSANESSYANHLKELFSLLKLNLTESRLNYDYGFSIVWRKFEKIQGPVIYLDSSKSSPIQGESNVLRYLNRLLMKESYENSFKPTQVALIDDLIDSCTNLLKNSTDQKQNANFLKSLNDRLTNSKFLAVDTTVSLADIYIWSVLKQRSKDIALSKFNNVNQWLNKVESNESFQLFQCLN